MDLARSFAAPDIDLALARVRFGSLVIAPGLWAAASGGNEKLKMSAAIDA